MKYLVVALSMLFVVGCSSTGTKLERIEANEAAISSLQTEVLDLQTTPEDTSCPAECDVKIDRAFEKSQYK